MFILLTIVHVIVCAFLVMVVLLQSGKAADLAGAFGGMGSQTVFGPRGSATVLSKATAFAAGLFMVTSMTLAIMAMGAGGGVGSTVLEKQGSQAKQPAQSAPARQTPAQQAPITVTPEGGKPIPIPVPPPPAGAKPVPAEKPAPKQ